MRVGLIILVAILGIAHAQVTIISQVSDESIALNQTITYEVSVNGNTSALPEPVLPEFSPQFTVISTSTSQFIQFINGQLNTTRRLSTRLRPTTTGTLKIAAARIKHNKKTQTSQSHIITVVSGNIQISNSPPDQRIQLIATVNKTSAYVGEPIIYDLQLYRNVSLSPQASLTPPTFTGFLTQDLPKTVQPRWVVSHGQRYYAFDVIKKELIGLQSGTTTIEPAVLDNSIQVNSQPITLTIKPLPERNKPKLPIIAIGQFSIAATLSATVTSPNTPLSLTLTLTGQGNATPITEIAIPKNPTYRYYLANSTPTNTGKQFHYVIIPTAPGLITIPEIPFASFNPKTRTYFVDTTAPMPITVIGESASEQPTPNTPELLFPAGLVDLPTSSSHWPIAWGILASINIALLGRFARHTTRFKSPKKQLRITLLTTIKALETNQLTAREGIQHTLSHLTRYDRDHGLPASIQAHITSLQQAQYQPGELSTGYLTLIKEIARLLG